MPQVIQQVFIKNEENTLVYIRYQNNAIRYQL